MGIFPEYEEILAIAGMSVATLLQFTGYDTQTTISEAVLFSIHSRSPDTIDSYAGYYGATVMFIFFTAFLLISPCVSNKIGAKKTLLFSSLFFTLYLAGFFHVNKYFFYFSQALQGIGFAVYYAGQGQYMAEHSTKDTISRNSVLISAIGNQSMFLGGLILILIYTFIPSAQLDESTTHTFRVFSENEIFIIFTVLLVSSIIGNIVFACLPSRHSKNSLADLEPSLPANLSNQLKLIWGTFTEIKIFALFPFFIFYGLHLAFYFLTFPTCFAFSSHLAKDHLLPAEYTIAMGIGSLIVGFFIQHMSKKNTSFGLIPTMVTQLVLSALVYTLTVLTTPNYSTMRPTTDDALWIQPGVVTVIAAGILHGMIDCCNSTMRTFVCAIAVPEKRLQAYCLAKFFQSISACLGSFVAPHLTIYAWVMLLIGTQSLAAIGFCSVCRRINKDAAAVHADSEKK